MLIIEKIHEYIRQLDQKSILRTRCISEPNNAHMTHFDRSDYLSLAQDKRITKAYQQGYKTFPVGSGGSMLLSGYHPNHLAVEQAFARWLEVDNCILFSSGYAANLAVLSVLGQIKAHCLIDKSVHASIYDGLSLSQVPFTRFQHNSMRDLKHKLQAVPPLSIVLTEGVFSMSGQLAPLKTMNTLCRVQQHPLLVDEAHSFGILGFEGKGAIDHFGLTQDDIPLRTIPLGKAFSAQGAIVAGQQKWIEALLQAGRSLIYSTAISPALSYGLLKTLDVIVDSDARREKLQYLIQIFKAEIVKSPLQWMDSSTPIQQLQLGCPNRALHYKNELLKAGFSCSAIRPPTVNLKSTGLRIILNYHHEDKQIYQLFKTLNTII